MNAVAVFPSSKEVRVIAHPDPPPLRADQALVRILDVDVCGTDREIASFQYGTCPPGSDYLVMGHEALGEVVEAGAAASGLRPGDLVVPMVRRPCADPSCRPCRAGRADFCSSGRFTERGIRGAHGYMTERVSVEARYLVPLSKSLRGIGVLVEPLTIAEKALLQVRSIQERLPVPSRHAGPAGGEAPHRALVIGAGPVGLLGAMALRSAAYEVAVYSQEAADGAKAAIARSIGARYVSAQGVPPASVPEAVGRIDLIYEAAGASKAAFDLIPALGTNGVFVFTGVPGRKSPVPVETARILRQVVLENQVLFGTVNAGRDAFEAAVRDLEGFEARWPEAVRSLLSGRSPLERAPALLEGRPEGIKNVVTPSPS